MKQLIEWAELELSQIEVSALFAFSGSEQYDAGRAEALQEVIKKAKELEDENE